MAKTKKCKQCGNRKPTSAFYTHKRNTDGLLGQCKECVKSRVKAHRLNNLDKIKAYDRQRGQDPARKAMNKRNYRRRTSTPEGRAAEWAKRAKPSQTKRAANIIAGNAIRDGRLVKKPCARCGSTNKVHAHHEDYFKPMKVIWLCPDHHGERHREINEEIRNGVDWSGKGF